MARGGGRRAGVEAAAPAGLADLDGQAAAAGQLSRAGARGRRGQVEGDRAEVRSECRDTAPPVLRLDVGEQPEGDHAGGASELVEASPPPRCGVWWSARRVSGTCGRGHVGGFGRLQ